MDSIGRVVDAIKVTIQRIIIGSRAAGD